MVLAMPTARRYDRFHETTHLSICRIGTAADAFAIRRVARRPLGRRCGRSGEINSVGAGPRGVAERAAQVGEFLPLVRSCEIGRRLVSDCVDFENDDRRGPDDAVRPREVSARGSCGEVHSGVHRRRAGDDHGAATADARFGLARPVAGKRDVAGTPRETVGVREGGDQDAAVVQAGDALSVLEHGDPARRRDCAAAEQDQHSRTDGQVRLPTAGDEAFGPRTGTVQTRRRHAVPGRTGCSRVGGG